VINPCRIQPVGTRAQSTESVANVTGKDARQSAFQPRPIKLTTGINAVFEPLAGPMPLMQVFVASDETNSWNARDEVRDQLDDRPILSFGVWHKAFECFRPVIRRERFEWS